MPKKYWKNQPAAKSATKAVAAVCGTSSAARVNGAAIASPAAPTESRARSERRLARSAAMPPRTRPKIPVTPRMRPALSEAGPMPRPK